MQDSIFSKFANFPWKHRPGFSMFFKDLDGSSMGFYGSEEKVDHFLRFSGSTLGAWEKYGKMEGDGAGIIILWSTRPGKVFTQRTGKIHHAING